MQKAAKNQSAVLHLFLRGPRAKLVEASPVPAAPRPQVSSPSSTVYGLLSDTPSSTVHGLSSDDGVFVPPTWSLPRAAGKNPPEFNPLFWRKRIPPISDSYSPPCL